MRHPNRLRVTLIRSTIGRKKNHKLCVQGLGLRRIGDTALVPDTPAIRGMIRRASYLLRVEEPNKTRRINSAWGITRSEQFVANLCHRAYLTLWTHPNPTGKKGKELCDCLIVCGPHVVIISVREIEYRETEDSTGWERWRRKALDKSAAQIWGAERWLDTVDEFVRKDGRKVTLPPKAERTYHRISVALGGRGQVPVIWGDLGHGFVHVCDERSTEVLFGALDTITDLVQYLAAVENLISGRTRLVLAGGGIEDLVALFLMHGESLLPAGTTPDLFILQENLWDSLSNSEDYKKHQAELEPSYHWDRLIQWYAGDLLTKGMIDFHSKEVTEDQLALATMALQPRLHRLPLAEALLDFLGNAEHVASRVVRGYADTAFVYLAGASSDREHRARELMLRCLVVRGRVPGVQTVVGIATDRPGTSAVGYASDIGYIRMTEWTAECEADVASIQAELGYFRGLSMPPVG